MPKVIDNWRLNYFVYQTLKFKSRRAKIRFWLEVLNIWTDFAYNYDWLDSVCYATIRAEYRRSWFLPLNGPKTPFKREREYIV